ncbi:dTDP-4-dehydrorhamnose reductase [bacterium]|nr:dTDP-4-dehydrorhamnose reductase [bacterium]
MLIGANGQLGQDLIRVLSHDFDITKTDIDQCDITSLAQVTELFESNRHDLVINTAAWTDVPGCETNDRKAFEVNALGAKYVAQNCERASCKLIHISTDYVFDGQKNKPYIESDLPAPLNVYGVSKLTGERYVAAYSRKHFIVRTSGLYGIHPAVGKKSNFVETMLNLAKEKDTIKVVDDEVLTPTFTVHLAQQIKKLIPTDYYGLYHATSGGACSWYEFTKKIFEIAQVKTKLEKTSVREFGSPLRRPAYSVLGNYNLTERGLDIMKPWEVALADYFLDKENKLKI